MEYAKIPEKDAVLLVRAMGLLMSQASVYGPSHNVTQSSARSVFAELEQAVKRFGAIEVAIHDQRLLINGSPDGLVGPVGKNLFDRMALHKISGLLFLPPPVIAEFLKCITLFGTQPLALAAEGGFEGALKRAALRGIQVVAVAYRRVDEQREEEKPLPLAFAEQPPVSAAKRPSPAQPVGVLDLSSVWGEEDARDGAGPEKTEQAPPTQARQKRSGDLASLLREAASLVEKGRNGSIQALSPDTVKTLSQVSALLSELTTDFGRQTSELADQVREDTQTIASIESAARRRGISLQITRGDLIRQYAELNQEIAQPLTVSTGVIDLLNSGAVGSLTEAQHELLKMAAESVARVNQLVGYMTRISGLPEGLIPDGNIIKESYR